MAPFYNFPAGVDGAGQCIGLIEGGGGYYASDLPTAFAAMGLPVPEVVLVPVDNATNNPATSGVSVEIALDMQVAGGLANGAKLVVYLAPDSSSRSLVDAVQDAVNDTTNKPTVLSFSIGNSESAWTGFFAAGMDAALASAMASGISVFAAAGDHFATNGDGSTANVIYPASSPLAIGCGGTSINTSGPLIVSEVVWNTTSFGTGGGISDIYAVPGFQANTVLPPGVTDGGHRRGVPDVAGCADNYQMVLGGNITAVGGTSAVAPLWAALTARLNQLLPPDAAGNPQTLGFFLPRLYQYPSVMRDITSGNNRSPSSGVGYDASPGWDACTGLGAPDGAALAILFTRTAVSQGPIAAAGWTDATQHVRVYCRNIQEEITEYCWDNGRWALGAILPLSAVGKLGAITWSDSNGAHVRLYYQNGLGVISEHCYDSGQWVPGATLTTAATGSNLAVMDWNDGSGTHVRVYYQDAQNVIREYCCDGGQWVPGATLATAAAGSGLAAGLWTDVNGIHVRVYYQDVQTMNREYAFEGSQWQFGQFALPAVQVG